MLLSRPKVVCLCRHDLITHIFGICTVPSCPCVRETEPGGNNTHLMPCDRCSQMTSVLYVLRTEILDIMVCEGCAETAVQMGVATLESPESAESSTA